MTRPLLMTASLLCLTLVTGAAAAEDLTLSPDTLAQTSPAAPSTIGAPTAAVPIAPPLAQPAPVQSTAAPAPALSEYTSKVISLNQINPRQNTQYRLASKIMTHRLLDQTHRGLGEIQDFTLAENGRMVSIEANVMAIGFDEVMSFDVAGYNVMPESNDYAVALTRSQIERNLPDFVASTEPAAGTNAALPITAQSLIGARVQTDQNRPIGIVDDVLVSDQRKAAVALLLTLMSNGGRTMSVAVPYTDAKISRAGAKATIVISEEQARIASAYAKGR